MRKSLNEKRQNGTDRLIFNHATCQMVKFEKFEEWTNPKKMDKRENKIDSWRNASDMQTMRTFNPRFLLIICSLSYSFGQTLMYISCVTILRKVN